MANEPQKQAPAKKDEVIVEILHGNYVHKAPEWRKDDKGELARDARGIAVAKEPYGHDAMASKGQQVIVSQAEAERLVAGGTAKLVG